MNQWIVITDFDGFTLRYYVARRMNGTVNIRTGELRPLVEYADRTRYRDKKRAQAVADRLNGKEDWQNGIQTHTERTEITIR